MGRLLSPRWWWRKAGYTPGLRINDCVLFVFLRWGQEALVIAWERLFGRLAAVAFDHCPCGGMGSLNHFNGDNRFSSSSSTWMRVRVILLIL